MNANVSAVRIVELDQDLEPQDDQDLVTYYALLGQARRMAETAASHRKRAQVFNVSVAGAPREVMMHLLEHGLERSSEDVRVTWTLRATYMPTEQLELIGGAWAYDVQEEVEESDE